MTSEHTDRRRWFCGLGWLVALLLLIQEKIASDVVRSRDSLLARLLAGQRKVRLLLVASLASRRWMLASE